MISPKECLVKVSYMLAVNGFNVVDLKPATHEHMALNYNKTDIYKSPIEFSVNGVTVWLYGNTLVINGDLVTASPFSVVETYKAIMNAMKRTKKSSGIDKIEKTQKITASASSVIAKYIYCMTFEACRA